MATLYAVVNGLAADGAPDTAADYVMTVDASASALKKVLLEDIGGASGTTLPATFQARLTLTTATPVTTADVTAATTLYLTPFRGNKISLYDGASAWAANTLTEISVALTGLAANTNYDVFVYDSGGLTLETLAWTNDTTRATALALQDGIYVKTGATARRYAGTIRTTGTIGQTEDSISKRYVWNAYNRIPRKLKVVDTADTWTYTTASFRSWDNSTNNRVEFVRGLNEEPVFLDFRALAYHSANSLAFGVGIGLDSVTVNSADLLHGATGTQIAPISAVYSGNPALGYHYLQLLEWAAGATTTFIGDSGVSIWQSGALGEVYG